MDTAIWIIIAVVVVIVLLAVVLLLARRLSEARRVKAQHLREDAGQQVSDVRQREAVAEEANARARQANAEADAKAAEAKQLGENARTRQGQAAEARHDVENELARADRLDPDIGRGGNLDPTQHARQQPTTPRPAPNPRGKHVPPEAR